MPRRPGTITAISKNADTITLSDGETYTLPEGIEDTRLRVGEKVQLTYTMKGGKAVVSHMAPAEVRLAAAGDITRRRFRTRLRPE
ncbi:DUF1344 domain-containing protein [Rhizobium beringeri]